ncbi:hypothetical protein MKW98_002152 [Papaver atlanticum]|uniref:CASP-like protein n=1 Tax=Papaver atlanticum TaxID=357466 RepID=A0AAD4X3T8_9MAGN|nr:hypothetical protein MKW98_002152 [Papaver atlanticum]
MSKGNGETVVDVPAEKSSNPNTASTKGKGLAAGVATGAAVVGTAKVVKHLRGWKRIVCIFDFLLRLFGVAVLLTAAVTMGTSDQILPFFTHHFQFRATFQDLPALTFFVAANAIACGYLLLSLPLSLISIIRPSIVGARLLLLIADTVMLALTSTGAASAAAIVYLAHVGNRRANWIEICQQFNEFCQQTSGAVVASFAGVLIFIILVIMSALALRHH